MTVNELSSGEGRIHVQYTLHALNIPCAKGDEVYIRRLWDLLLPKEDYDRLKNTARYLGVSNRFRDVIETFRIPENETPAGFRIEASLQADGLLRFDLVRDISYDKNGVKRPTGVLFSADSANPYEVAPISPLLANLTCNPGIIYDLFLNNPQANTDHRFTTRDQVMAELGRILGPGCDISVELNNPFEQDFGKILEECERFREILTPYRLVIKVPHMGPVNGENVSQLLTGDRRLRVRYTKPATADAFHSHTLALKLREHGYRINYTLMFEPYQSALALQAKPAFINSFIRHRAKQSDSIARLLSFYKATDDPAYLEEIRSLFLAGDYLAGGEEKTDLLTVKKMAQDIVAYRNTENPEGADGLDGVRHNLRLLRHTNLRDTRLIICSMEGDYNYPDIDRLLTDPAFGDVADRVVITAEPSYLARFTSANQVVSYQRRFMNAAKGQA